MCPTDLGLPSLVDLLFFKYKIRWPMVYDKDKLRFKKHKWVCMVMGIHVMLVGSSKLYDILINGAL